MDNITLISNNTEISGTINAENPLRIEGKVDGKIISKDLVEVGPNGQVKCEIKAKKFVVLGKFEGDVTADEVEILKDGSILGKIFTDSLVIERGATFEGESKKINGAKK